jgi:endoglucanase
MKVYVYGPDPLSSWTFATAAARFSTLVQPFDAPLAATYRNCAIKAMDWAETEAPRVKAKLNWDGWDARNLAALEVYRLTGEMRYHEIFLENTVLKDASPRLFNYGTAVQTDAAFAYARLPKGVGDEAMKARAVAAIEREAQTSLKYGEGNGWNIIKSDPGAPAILGYYSTPGGTELARAHFLTGKPEYLGGVVQSTLFCVGANPSNTVYTSGLGTRPVLPFKIDYRLTGQPVPEGLTVYGNCDFKSFGDGGFFTWPIQWHISRVAVPNAYTWPIHEALFETYLYPGQLEYTVDAWAPNVYVWGYLAGRK